MIEINRIVENAVHDSMFEVNRPSGHPVYLLLLVKSDARFKVDGEWIETAPDTAVLFKPGQKHRYCACGDFYMNNWMHFSSAIPILGDQFPFGKPIALHQAKEFYDLFHLIHNEYYRVSPHRSMIMNNLTMALLDKLYDHCNGKGYPDIYYRLSSLRELIFSNPSRQWTIKEMSASLNVSTSYLHTLYRQYFKTTCMQDVIQSRIQYACELLSANNKSTKEIAELCGYRSTEHFIKQFKLITGMTPGSFRKTTM